MGKFYHYTNKEGYKAIKKSKKIKKSKTEGVNAVFGYGVYLTSLSPQDRTNRGIANNNYDGSKDKFARRMLRAEAEKPRRRVGIADRKVFARPESFCAYNIVPKNKSKHGISFWIVWKVS